MASFAKVYLLILVMFSDGFFVSGEMFQFFLDILDMMDPSWIYSTYDTIRTKIECASLCYRDKGSCSYFGYKGSTCYLLKDSVDRDMCSQDDCSNSGMRVYKWKQQITSTEQTVRETSTIKSSTTPEVTTTSTHDVTTTTTPASTTTTSREETTSTTTPTTTVTETTTRIDDTTTTTEDSTTTTTTEDTTATTTTTTTDGITTNIEDTTEGSTSSTTEETTTRTEDPTTTTTESTTTTTTKTPTTTTTESTTTTEATSTTTEGWNCDPPDGLEGEVNCPKGIDLLKAMGTRSKFLVDVFFGICTTMQEQVFVDEEEVHTFFTLDGGTTLNAKCPHIHHVIYKFKLCVKKDHPAAITLHCRYLKDPDRIQERFNETNNDLDNLVDCGDNSAIQSISFGPHSFNDKLTMIYFACVKVEVEELVPSADSPDPGAG